MKMQEKMPMITKSRLKSERGWTDKLIKEFLSVPDLTKPNPNYKSGPPMLLFDTDRIEKIEQTEEFKAQKPDTEKRKKRQASAKKAVETKMQRMREWLNTVEIHVPVFDKSELINRACSNYNTFLRLPPSTDYDCDYYVTATADSDPEFLDRICVNYLRHRLTKYEKYLDEMSGKVGFEEGYKEIRRKILSKISENYHWLADECKRQQ
jgi:hypothetical protein